MLCWKGLLWLVIFMPTVLSLKMAKLRHSLGIGFRTTSSTLAWIPIRDIEPHIENVVHVGSGGPTWCRLRLHSQFLSGVVLSESCHAPFLKKVEISQNFDVLISLNGATRLVEKKWDLAQSFPEKIVTTPDRFLALTRDPEGGALLPGYVVPNERRAYFLQGSESLKSEEAYLVTEVEPSSYRLEDVRLRQESDKKTENFHDEILQEVILSNSEKFPNEIVEEILLNSSYIVNYRKPKGTILGLPATVSGPDVPSANIHWGIQNDQTRVRTVQLAYILPPESSVKVKIVAKIRTLEAAYSGVLKSVYSDGVVLNKTVSDVMSERQLAELRAEFDEILPPRNSKITPPTSIVLLYSTTTPIPPPFSEEALSAEASVNSCRIFQIFFVSVFFHVLVLTAFNF